MQVLLLSVRPHGHDTGITLSVPPADAAGIAHSVPPGHGIRTALSMPPADGDGNAEGVPCLWS